METLLKCIRVYGWWNGIILAIRLKLLRSSILRIPGLAHELNIRPGSIDVYSIDEIFLQQVYAINWPDTWSEPKVIVDAGANIGCTTAFFANQFPKATILAIEPELENFNLLKRNTSFYPKVSVLKAAVWNTDGHIQVLDAGYGKRGFIVQKCTIEAPEAIEAFSISSILQRFPESTIDILKIDIEGSEKEVFSEGFQNWLPRCRCVMIELHDRMKDGCSQAVFNAFSKYDFSCEISGGNLVFYNQREI